MADQALTLPGAKAKPQRRLPASAAASLAHVEAKLGGREALVHALSLAPASEALDRFLAACATAEHGRAPGHHQNARQVRHLHDLCLSAGCLPRDVLKWVKEGQQAEAEALSRAAAYKEAPAVAADVMRKAQPHEGVCEDCHGRGYRNRLQQDVDENDKPVGEPYLVRFPCAECDATGYVTREAKPADVEQALALAGLVTKSPAVSVTNQQLQIAPGTLHGSLPQLQRAVDQILHGDAFGEEVPPPPDVEVIDATPVPPPSSAVSNLDTPCPRPYPAPVAPEEIVL